MKIVSSITAVLILGLFVLLTACPGTGTGSEEPSPEPTAEPTPTPPLAGPTATPFSLSFPEFQSIATSGAFDWEYFAIGEEHFLAVANNYNDTSYTINSVIYKWNGYTFSPYQNIPTQGALDWEFFTISTDSFLVVANHYNPANGTPSQCESAIYKWNTQTGLFEPLQTLTTYQAFDWESFTIGFDQFLVVANCYNGTTHNINSVIYNWNGAAFVEFQSIPTNGAMDWVFFTIREDYYLAVANYSNGSTYNIQSHIYKWDGTVFTATPYQSINTYGARDWEHFTTGENHFLVVANFKSGSNFNIDSRIYKWDPATGRFLADQPIATHGAIACKYFSAAGSHFLAVANNYNGTSWNIDSQIYQWNGSGFDTEHPFSIRTTGITDWEFFTIGEDNYLAGSNNYNGTSYNIFSNIYRIVD